MLLFTLAEFMKFSNFVPQSFDLISVPLTSILTKTSLLVIVYINIWDLSIFGKFQFLFLSWTSTHPPYLRGLTLSCQTRILALVLSTFTYT